MARKTKGTQTTAVERRPIFLGWLQDFLECLHMAMCFYLGLHMLNTCGCELIKEKVALCQVCIPSSKQSACLAHTRLTLNICWMNFDIYDTLKGSENEAIILLKTFSKYESFKCSVQRRGEGSSLEGRISWIWDGVKMEERTSLGIVCLRE